MVPASTDKLTQISLVLKESPKLRALLATFAEDVIRDGKKLILFVKLPAQQLLVTEILNAIRVSTRMISADLTIAQRVEVVSNFATTAEPMVLVLTYNISACGLNLQNR